MHCLVLKGLCQLTEWYMLASLGCNVSSNFYSCHITLLTSRQNVALMPKGVRICQMASKVFLTYGIVAEVVMVGFSVLGRAALC